MWFVLALLSGFLFAANKLIVRSAFVQNVNPIKFGAIHELIAGILILPIGLFYFSLPASTEIWIALLLGIIFIFLADLFAFLALTNIEASIYQIIGQLRHALMLIGGYFFFTEIISFSKILSVLFIILGVVVAIRGKTKIEINKETIYALLSTIGIVLASLFIKMASVDVAPTFSASLSLIISGLLMSASLFLNKKRPTSLLPKTHKKELIFAAGIFAVFEIVFFTALAVGEASKVTPVTQSSMIFTLIGGYIFLHEREHMKQKIVGSTLIAVGIIVLYFI